MNAIEEVINQLAYSFEPQLAPQYEKSCKRFRLVLLRSFGMYKKNLKW